MKPTVVVINLDSRPDRLAAFTTRWNAAGVGIPFTVFPAIEGGAAGCLASHIEVLAAFDAPLLVVEDDACFAPGFTLDLTPPPGWVIAWLGGQHLFPPRPVDQRWVRPTLLARTHGYLVRDTTPVLPRLKTLHRRGQDIDPYMSTFPVPQYAQQPFTIGQAADTSDIDGTVRTEDQFWNRTPETGTQTEFIPWRY